MHLAYIVKSKGLLAYTDIAAGMGGRVKRVLGWKRQMDKQANKCNGRKW